jgi:hypothetical protein
MAVPHLFYTLKSSNPLQVCIHTDSGAYLFKKDKYRGGKMGRVTGEIIHF